MQNGTSRTERDAPLTPPPRRGRRSSARCTASVRGAASSVGVGIAYGASGGVGAVDEAEHGRDLRREDDGALREDWVVCLDLDSWLSRRREACYSSREHYWVSIDHGAGRTIYSQAFLEQPPRGARRDPRPRERRGRAAAPVAVKGRDGPGSSS